MRRSNFRLTWSQVGKYSKQLAILIEDHYSGKVPYDYVIGILRGGTTLATVLSYTWDIPMAVIGVRGFDRDDPDNVYRSCYGSILLDAITKKDHVLLVDDVIDHGNTIKASMSFIKTKHVDVCCLISKLTLFPIAPNQAFISKYIDPQCWVQFPWEATSEQKKK